MTVTARPLTLLAAALALVTVAAGQAGAAHPAARTAASAPGTRIHVLPKLTEHRLGPVGALPFGAGLPLGYGGGAVEVTNTAYAIFWEPTSGQQVSSTYNGLITRYFNDIGGSALFGTTTQYYQTVNGPRQHITNTATFGGSYVDTAAYPDGNLTDADIQAEVLRAMAANGWTAGVGHEFFVYTNPGAITQSSYCAYHGTFASGGTDVLYANLPYGGMPGCTQPASPNGDPAADAAMDATSHEQWETITDPLVGSGWTTLAGDEGSDQCNHTYGPTDAAGADTTLHGHPYLLQLEWSNAPLLLGCVMS